MQPSRSRVSGTEVVVACENHAHQPLRYTQEVLLKEHAPGSFCMTPGRIVWELALYYGTHKGAFSSLFDLSGDLIPKYLTSLMMLWSILQGGNSAPENELCP